MAVLEKDLRLVRKKFEDKRRKNPDRIRLGNHFVDDFIFEDQEAADIPINALRVILILFRLSVVNNSGLKTARSSFPCLIRNLKQKIIFLHLLRSGIIKYLQAVRQNKLWKRMSFGPI